MTHIDKHFNQNSNKILSVDEIANRCADKDPDDVALIKDILSDFSEWKDAGGKLYMSEVVFKRLFSSLAAASGEKGGTLASVQFPKWQGAIDASEDHSGRLNAGRLHPKSSAFAS